MSGSPRKPIGVQRPKMPRNKIVRAKSVTNANKRPKSLRINRGR